MSASIIIASLVAEGRRCDLLQQKPVSAVEIEEGRKLGADLLADRIKRYRIGHQPVEGEKQLIEQVLVAAVLCERGHQLRCERCEVHCLDLIDELPCQEATEARILGRRECLGQNPEDKAGKTVAPFWIAQPIRRRTRKIDLPQLGPDGSGREKMCFDKFPEPFRNSAMVCRDDGVAVWGIGRPSGRLNRTTTAYQSARPPIVAASAKAARNPKLGLYRSRSFATTRTPRLASRTPPATSLVRLSSRKLARVLWSRAVAVGTF
jgi:hypothetical protein